MSETVKNVAGVPSYQKDEFAPKHSEYCLLIPIINEGQRILTELSRARKAGVDQLCDIILCDGGSTDGSMSRAGLVEIGRASCRERV